MTRTTHILRIGGCTLLFVLSILLPLQVWIGNYQVIHADKVIQSQDISRGNRIIDTNIPITPAPHLTPPRVQDKSVSIVGKPDLTGQQVNNVLCAASSPACGDGSYFYEYSQQYEIKDSFMLAVFEKESGFGKTGCAYYNHSISNTEPNRGFVGNPGICNGRFAYFPTWQDSIQNQAQQLREKYVNLEGRTTVASVIAEYAPPSENNTAAYIQFVESEMARWTS